MSKKDALIFPDHLSLSTTMSPRDWANDIMKTEPSHPRASRHHWNALCSPWLLAWGFRNHQESGREAVKHQRIPWAFPAEEPPHPWMSPHTDLPAVWPSPPYGLLLPMALPSSVSPHHMDHLTVNGLLKAKAIEELCFLDSLWVLPPALTHQKRLWYWEGLGAGGEGDDRGWDGWMASLTRWTWVWGNSRSWWWTGRPGVLWFTGSQRVRHDWATDLIWSDLIGSKCQYLKMSLLDESGHLASIYFSVVNRVT